MDYGIFFCGLMGGKFVGCLMGKSVGLVLVRLGVGVLGGGKVICFILMN